MLSTNDSWFCCLIQQATLLPDAMSAFIPAPFPTVRVWFAANSIVVMTHDADWQSVTALLLLLKLMLLLQLSMLQLVSYYCCNS